MDVEEIGEEEEMEEVRSSSPLSSLLGAGGRSEDDVGVFGGNDGNDGGYEVTGNTTPPRRSSEGKDIKDKSKDKSPLDKRLFCDEMKFMKDFDPSSSERLIKKKMKRFTDDGIVIERCDCLIDNCPGCHFFPCKSCGRHTCGHECRVNRRWEYEELEIQGNGSQPFRRSRRYSDDDIIKL